MSKIKVFLSGIVNSTNAQNLNCLALARHLDKSKFEVQTLTVYSGNLQTEKIDSVNYLTINYPSKIWYPIQLIRGILWSDVAYLCKPEYWRIQRFLVKYLHKKSFQTIEGVFFPIDLENETLNESDYICLQRRRFWESAMTILGKTADIREAYSYTGHCYSITEAMREPNEKSIGLKTEKKILYLGTETNIFNNDISRLKLTDIAIVGGNLFYKGLNDYFKIATHFPKLKFHVIGSGMGKVAPKAEVEKLGLKNVICHGSLDHTHLAELLKSIQLHIFPSRAEGFPKVTLETAAAGVPSLVYGDYGANEWIKHGKSGFVVNTLEEMIAVVQDLMNHPEKLQYLADNAREMAKRFDWNERVKDWEAVIEEIYND